MPDVWLHVQNLQYDISWLRRWQGPRDRVISLSGEASASVAWQAEARDADFNQNEAT
jgi:hypothetical protein